MKTIKYCLTIKDQFNVNKLNISVTDGITVNDILFIKHYPNESKVRFFPILDYEEYDNCIGVDDLRNDKFMTTFIINNNFFVVERGENNEI